LIPLAPVKNNLKFNPKKPTTSKSTAPYQLFNIGNNSPIALLDFIKAIEKVLGKKGKMVLKPMQAGDVSATYADVTSLYDYIDFKPNTPIEVGIKAFIEQYLNFKTQNL
jgi:UDP-glucuronate 4-epimerase